MLSSRQEELVDCLTHRQRQLLGATLNNHSLTSPFVQSAILHDESKFEQLIEGMNHIQRVNDGEPFQGMEARTVQTRLARGGVTARPSRIPVAAPAVDGKAPKRAASKPSAAADAVARAAAGTQPAGYDVGAQSAAPAAARSAEPATTDAAASFAPAAAAGAAAPEVTAGKSAFTRAAGSSTHAAFAATEAAAPAASAAATQSSAASYGSASTAALAPTGGASAAAATDTAAAAAAATNSTIPEPQPADGDSNSPYDLPKLLIPNFMLHYIDIHMVQDIKAMYREHEAVQIPGAPATAAAAAKLQAQIDQLLADGRSYEAFPWQCQIAMYCFTALGSEHSETVDSVYAVLSHLQQRGEHTIPLLEWLLPRCASQHGLGSPQLRQLVEWGAELICNSHDLRYHPTLTQQVIAFVALLPGGLGWGQTGSGDIDMDGYNYHAVLNHKACQLVMRGQYELALKMLGRSLQYFTEVGPHWLVVPRVVRVIEQLGFCTYKLDGEGGDGEQMLLKSKRMAKECLGPKHNSTLRAMDQHAELLMLLNRKEAAMALFMKTQRLRKAALGPCHHRVFESEVGIARVLMREPGKRDAAERMLKEVFESGLKAIGPTSVVMSAGAGYFHLLKQRPGTQRELAAMRKRAAKLGYALPEAD